MDAEFGVKRSYSSGHLPSPTLHGQLDLCFEVWGTAVHPCGFLIYRGCQQILVLRFGGGWLFNILSFCCTEVVSRVEGLFVNLILVLRFGGRLFIILSFCCTGVVSRVEGLFDRRS